MSWVKLDDRYFSNGKIRHCTPCARLLHVASMCHCAAALNDGEFPASDLSLIQAMAGVLDPEAVNQLAEVGLWDVLRDGLSNDVTGYRVHDFLEYNPPAARVLSARKATAERVAKWRGLQSNAVTGAVTNGVSNGHGNTAPPSPVPRPLPGPVPIGSICPETPADGRSRPAVDDSPVQLDFPCDGEQKTWGLTLRQVEEWRALFPSLGILDESRKALAWVQASPERRKTAKGMKRFLVGWFGRAQNGGKVTAAQVPRVTNGSRPVVWRES